jgi:thiosulfate/3-mercaptopyruvate sulfurtransferase
MKRTSPLISAEELLELVRAEEPDLLIVDCRWVLGEPGVGATAYAEGHLPGAVHLDLDEDLTDLKGYGAPGRHPLPAPATFAARLARAGINDSSLVVGYDDVGGWVAARLWWMLDVLGHPAVAVLDGGLAAWTAAGGELTTAMPDPAPGELHLAPDWSRVIERDELKARLGTVALLDARGAERYRGETEPIDPVAGHIPTAVSAPVDDSLVGPGGTFRPAAQLAQRFHDLGADGSEMPVVTSCGSGVSALHHALAMRAAGLPDPLLYVGSYSDWSRSGEPVAVGPEPGEAPAG